MSGLSDESSDFVVAIDFGGTKVAAGTAALDGTLLRFARIKTEAAHGAEQAVQRAVLLARDLRDVTAEDTVPPRRCVAAAAVSPGIVLEDSVLLAPNVPGWGELALPGLLRAGLGMETVAVGNDVNAAALAEARWGALAGADPALFVSLGTGIAAGIVIGGRIFDGAHGAAGEIGYSLRHPKDGVAFADGHAPLEEFAGGRAIGERAGRVEDTLAELSMQLANVAIALDPQRVAVGGGLMAHGDVIIPALRERMQAAVPFPPDVVWADFPDDGALRGAVALALDLAAAEVVS
jgi:glucokinase